MNSCDNKAYQVLAGYINDTKEYKLVLVQHEFGFFSKQEAALLQLIQSIRVPVIITFHTVLPNPDTTLKLNIQQLTNACCNITVMTKNAAQILERDYQVAPSKISIIPHGTHLVQHLDKTLLKHKYGFNGRNILSTFGLISSGKSIETTLDALPEIIQTNPDVLFLVIGKTHPSVVKQEGEKYRNMLKEKVTELSLEQHVQFVNYYLPLPDLLEYLQLTDIYLFTSKDPNQAVSGTFSYAISCGCPIVSTPIPHAKEVLRDDAGILIDFENSGQLSDAVKSLLHDEQLRKNISSNGLHRIAATSWENVAIAHALLFDGFIYTGNSIQFRLPQINLDHIKNLTTDIGMIQFSRINNPDHDSGYTVDDNARALIAMCMHYETTGDINDLVYISRYLHFLGHCIQDNGRFKNYVDSKKQFTAQNEESNLDDANGRAIWALGFLVSHKHLLPEKMVCDATGWLDEGLKYMNDTHSTRAMAFALKGLFYYHQVCPTPQNRLMALKLATKLERMYMHECDTGWNWFESYLTYGNSVLPEAMLCAYLITENERFKSIALSSFDFLLSKTFTTKNIKLISNRSWWQKGKIAADFGEQPIDAAYTILALGRFHDVFKDEHYLQKMKMALSWFLGNNHLHQIIYNSCTGGCYDGLEETHVNLNQGAESTVSYLMARLTAERYLREGNLVEKELAHQLQGI
jgi:glycosyltransferase involved in cell wall biosynthesis